MLFSQDSLIRARAEALFTDAGVKTRREAIESMQSALSLTGSAENGRRVFTSLCSQCHKVGNSGANVGPDLTEIYVKSAESVMFDILDPNAIADPQYVNHTIRTKAGEIITGIVNNETDHEITLKGIEGAERTVPRDQIQELRTSGLSFMPEGFENQMDTQEMADLLAYLQEYR